MVLLGNTGQEDLAYLQGEAFQVQTFFGTELLASSADPFEDGNPARVLLGDASWDAHLLREEGSNPDNHLDLGGHHQILAAACIEAVVAVAAADQLRIPRQLP